jgi:hypothetical protein
MAIFATVVPGAQLAADNWRLIDLSGRYVGSLQQRKPVE